MIFIDADKENYQNYYEESLDLINKDGLIVIDNVLWHGEVADPTITDKFTTIIRNFNTLVADDKRCNNLSPIVHGFKS